MDHLEDADLFRSQAIKMMGGFRIGKHTVAYRYILVRHGIVTKENKLVLVDDPFSSTSAARGHREMGFAP